MAFPSTVSSFNRPTPSDRLNSPSHSALHNSVSSAVSQIETFIGTLPSSAVGTILYDVRSPSSDGGGHIQTALKGGTGQTLYTKGDLLVAQAPSVLGKLAVGTDGFNLAANSSVASGIEWVPNSKPKIFVSASVQSYINAGERSVFSVTVPGSTLGTNNAIRATAYVNDFLMNQGASVLTTVFYGGNAVGAVSFAPTIAPAASSICGTLEYTLIANASDSLQRGILRVSWDATRPNNVTSILGVRLFNTATSSVNSSANQTLGMTVRNFGASTSLDIDGVIVEKIS